MGIRRWLGLITLSGAISLLAIEPPISGASPQKSDSSSLTFEVVSIHPVPPGQRVILAGVRFSPGRITAECANLRNLLSYAYHLSMSVPKLGLPKWSDGTCGAENTDVYVVEATMPTDTTQEQSRQMMQNMLADRFKLAVHWEKKEMKAYSLVVRQDGFKAQPIDPANSNSKRGGVSCPEDDPGCHRLVGTGTMRDLAGMLSLSINAGRPVIDETGVSGIYDIGLKWASDQAPESSLPSLPAALREKFGLELKPKTGPVDVLVIDHVERPSAN
ncbi:MAG TPA: TIGR03435 family protein [Candidatus Acidoferrales bacterium]|nr:TIGR03435 family protein [Candidatus Acidoferrales bacterium]